MMDDVFLDYFINHLLSNSRSLTEGQMTVIILFTINNILNIVDPLLVNTDPLGCESMSVYKIIKSCTLKERLRSDELILYGDECCC